MSFRSDSIYSSTVFSDVSETNKHTGWRKVFNRRNVQSLLILCVSILPILIIVIQSSIKAKNAVDTINKNVILAKDIEFSVQLGSTIHALQIERGISALYIGAGYSSAVISKLYQAHKNTDKVVLQLPHWPGSDEVEYLSSVENLIDAIHLYRLNLNNETIPGVINFYTNINTRLIQWIGDTVQGTKNGQVWLDLVGYHFLILCKENTGIERALGSTFFATGGFDKTQSFNYHSRKSAGNGFLTQSMQYSDKINQKIKMHRNSDLYAHIEEQRERINRNNETQPSLLLGELWFSNLTSYLEILQGLEESLANKLVENLDVITKATETSLSLALVALIIPTSLSPFIVISINKLVSKMQHFNKVLRSKGDDERKERKRTQTLLYEMLPISIARKLLNAEKVDPTSYKNVTIFFSDICDFADIVADSSPLQIIDMMNTLYRVFDNQLNDYDVYKVETIGDCYMVASGLPSLNEKHAREAANFALDVVETFTLMKVPHKPDFHIMIRIGLNSGPVVSGVVGLKMPRYCLFGDTVNTSSRMMSTGAGGRIHISDSTKRELEKRKEFSIESRGAVKVKGKGEMTTHWLKSRLRIMPKSPALNFKVVDEDALSCL